MRVLGVDLFGVRVIDLWVGGDDGAAVDEGHVTDLGADRVVAVPEALLGVEGVGFYNQDR